MERKQRVITKLDHLTKKRRGRQRKTSRHLPPIQIACSFCGKVKAFGANYVRWRLKTKPSAKFYCGKGCHTNSMKKDPKKKTRSKEAAKRATQTVVNKYCRLRDCYGDEGAACISCGEWKPFDKGDGGHFIATTSSAVRFDERNINFQCHRCNRFLHGNAANYYVGMVRKYGQEVVDELMARQHESKKWLPDELIAIRKYYNDKIKSIERGERPANGKDYSGMAVLDMFADLGAPEEV